MNAHRRSLVRVPLALNTSQATTAEFVADLDTIYFVQIDLRRNLPFEELQKIHLPKIIWSVISQGRNVGQEYSGQYWGETVGYIVGKFEGVAGHKYQLRIQLQQNAFYLGKLNPYVIVVVAPNKLKRHFLISWLLAYLSILLIVIAFGCLLFSNYQIRKNMSGIGLARLTAPSI
jgi:hypothetical protein